VEVGLICIFIAPCILNEARVSGYIQDILRHEATILNATSMFLSLDPYKCHVTNHYGASNVIMTVMNCSNVKIGKKGKQYSRLFHIFKGF